MTPTPKQLVFTYKEVAAALLRAAGVTEGHWGLHFRFGLAATNIGPSDNELSPAAIVAISEIGLQQFQRPTNLSVDAAEVTQNASAPRPAAREKKTKAKTKATRTRS